MKKIPTFTCPKSTKETLEKGVNYVKVNNKDPRKRHSGFFIVNFKHISHFFLVFL